MTLIPIWQMSKAEIRMLGVNIVSAARADHEIDAVNRSVAIHNEQIESPIDHKPAELTAAIA
jgi:hypothetical protein